MANRNDGRPWATRRAAMVAAALMPFAGARGQGGKGAHMRQTDCTVMPRRSGASRTRRRALAYAATGAVWGNRRTAVTVLAVAPARAGALVEIEAVATVPQA